MRPPCNDTKSLIPDQRKMTISLGKVFGVALNESEVKVLIASFPNGAINQSTIQPSIIWGPRSGNVADAATASSITKHLGWALAKVIGRREMSLGRW